MDIFKKITIVQTISLVILLIIFIIYSSQQPTFPEKSKIHSVFISQALFGVFPNGERVLKYNLKNKNNFELDILTYGATLKTAMVPDKYNKRVNVMLNFDELSGYYFYNYTIKVRT